MYLECNKFLMKSQLIGSYLFFLERYILALLLFRCVDLASPFATQIRHAGDTTFLDIFRMRLRTDIDFPTGKLCGQTDILPAAADRQTQLPLWNVRTSLTPRHNFNTLHLRRRQRISN